VAGKCPGKRAQIFAHSLTDSPICNFVMLHFQEQFMQAKSCLFLLKFILNQLKVDYEHVEKSNVHHREEYILVALKKFSKDWKTSMNLFMRVNSTLSSIVFKYTLWFD